MRLTAMYSISSYEQALPVLHPFRRREGREELKWATRNRSHPAETSSARILTSRCHSLESQARFNPFRERQIHSELPK